MKVAIIGSGSWGTALSIKSVEAGNDTYLYCRRPEFANLLTNRRENTEYLPGVMLPTALSITSSSEEALRDVQIVLLVTPSVYVRTTLQSIKKQIPKHAVLVLCSKGIDRSSGTLLLKVIEEELGDDCHLAILSGPNHAEEIGRGLPAATVVAAKDMTIAKQVQGALNSSNFRVYVNDDYIGLELAAATKNIIALAAGIVDELQLGDNTKATLLTRGLYEMTKFGVAFGAKKETYAGLAGIGDLIATCMSQHSRNRAAGQQLAMGQSMTDIMGQTNMVVEGFYAVEIVHRMAMEHDVDMPITQALYDILYNHKTPLEALAELMQREMKVESYL
ncbi:glycerol-3-phosphate dehydrogenase [Veillonella montpellierensis DNF00314]|uniref:Glycerol-3-phosphate dehydrogenase [NAD(P)+] n=1 Tax=Veillonella montpellierensis DNF00314 TaxID=1401067 RepID=A0A096AK46_9FIRM|nr:NAD(P)H-dependent glycerol-3-phosphate dehydrogenase [Veillonella montpellierensis]KGF47473.1 glycerol-3-phosphate dehydrogenase [Veillonella montpellierensis DNF00314]